MPNYTFFLDSKSGNMMIHKYEASYTVDDLLIDVATPSYEGEVIFHSEFDFVTVVGSVSVDSVTLPPFTRELKTWSSGDCGCF